MTRKLVVKKPFKKRVKASPAKKRRAKFLIRKGFYTESALNLLKIISNFPEPEEDQIQFLGYFDAGNGYLYQYWGMNVSGMRDTEIIQITTKWFEKHWRKSLLDLESEILARMYEAPSKRLKRLLTEASIDIREHVHFLAYQIMGVVGCDLVQMAKVEAIAEVQVAGAATIAMLEDVSKILKKWDRLK